MVNIDGRSDLYSLGCTMYHLLSGQLPFKGESSMDCLVGRITGHAVPISEIAPGLPPRLVQTIEKLMATSPDDRYQTADEAATALRSLLRPKAVAPSPSASTAPAIPSEPVPAPVPNGTTTVEAPAPPVPAGPRASKPTEHSFRSRLTARGTKAKRVFAVAAVAVAAVSLIVGAIMFFGSPNDQPPASSPDSLSTNTSPITPADGVEVRQSSSVIENPKQEPVVQ